MGWQDRIKQAAYIAPDGTRQEFIFEDVSFSFQKKTSSHDFRNGDGSYIQERGNSGRKYPMRVIFSGDDCDLEADAFLLLITQRGQGRLEHPLYGTFDVVPTGSISRNDALKSASNQTIIEVEFFETIGLIYPSQQIDAESQITSAIEKTNEATSTAFDSLVDIETPGIIAELKSGYSKVLDFTKQQLDAVVAANEELQQQFDDVYDAINFGIDSLISDPLTIAFQTSILVQTPARSSALIADRLKAYGNLATSIVSNSPKSSNELQTDDLYLILYQTGSILSVLNTTFDTKPDAINSASLLLDQLSAITDWRDQNYNDLDVIDTGKSYQQMQNATALAAGWLVKLSFNLKQERKITLTKSYSAIDLCGELYNEIDGKLNLLIDSNQLSGSEILEISHGREIVYYV